MIVALHAKVYMGWSWLSAAPASLVQGVSFFFVLSGFILTLVHGEKATLDARTFFTARLARVFPCHLAALALVLILLPWSTIRLGSDTPATALLIFAQKLTLTDALNPVQNVYFAWNMVSWSLSTELCFYLLFPLLVRDIQTTWLRKLGLSAALAALSYTLPRLMGLPEYSSDESLSVIEMNYASPIARLFEFSLGMAMCALWRKHLRGRQVSKAVGTLAELGALALVGLGLLKGAAVAQSILPTSLHAWFTTSGLCFVFALTIVVFASGHGHVARLLSTRAFVYCGEVSFAIYLVHETLMTAIKARGLDVLATPPAYFALLIAIAVLLHERVEKPARRWIVERFRRRDVAAPPRAAIASGP